MEIGVGIVGYGLAGKVFHGPLVREAEGLAVRAIVTAHPDRQEAARTDFPDAKIYSEVDAMLTDDDVELVVLGTPHETHLPLTLKAVASGRHVVVDKIMALGPGEADQMIEAAEKKGVLLSVFHNRRWDSDFLTVKRALEEGWIGEPYSVESSVVGYRTPPQGELPWRALASRGGGVFRDWGAHLMDQAVQLFGLDLVRVVGDFQYRWPGVDVETAATCDMVFASGVRYRVEVGHISKIGRPRWYVRGSEGALVVHGLDPQENALKAGRIIGGAEEAKMPAEHCRLESNIPGAKLQIVPGDYRMYYRGIARALLEGSGPPVDPRGVRDVLAVMERAILDGR